MLSALSSACGAEAVTVSPFNPTLPTTPSAGGPVGITLNDSATITGGFNPTGSITFKLYGPNDLTCAKAAIYTQTVATVGGGASNSPAFTTSQAGTYEWTVSYPGDA